MSQDGNICQGTFSELTGLPWLEKVTEFERKSVQLGLSGALGMK